MSQQSAQARKQEDERRESDSPVSDRLTRQAHHVVDEAGEKASNVERNVRDKAETAQERIDEGREAAGERLEEGKVTVENFIREKPLAAAGIAFATGIVAAKLLSK